MSNSLRHTAIWLVAAFAFSPASQAIVGSNSGPNAFNGLYINEHVGAGTFYSMGFGGQGAIVANIEAGAIWNGHETLSHVTTVFHADSPGTQLGQADWHATMVGHVLGGRGIYTYQDGIAPLAELWSGSIATQWVSEGFDYTGSFSTTSASVESAYRTALVTGINGQFARVVNSSWGYPDPYGDSSRAVFVDALLRSSGAVGVFAAGNSGPSAGSVGAPASGFNGISVAALGSDTSSPPFGTVAEFSSRGPQPFFNPATNRIEGSRPGIDIAAPGTNMNLAFYGGLTGGHLTGIDPTAGSGLYYVPNMDGTSFAAPIVAGGAALLAGAAEAFGVPDMDHGLVIKSVMMTGAAKPAGWDNGQQVVDGVTQTTQALDHSTGSGALDLDATYRVFIGDPAQIDGLTVGGLNTQLGVPGLSGGTVDSRGWDLGSVAADRPSVYFFSDTFEAGNRLTATLNWFADRFGDLLSSAEERRLADLSLELRRLVGTDEILVARSDAPASTVEHFALTIPETGLYVLRVTLDGYTFDLAPDPFSSETTYAVSWNMVAIPEPGVLWLGGLALVICLAKHRLSRKSTARALRHRPCPPAQSA
ncbi:MAG: S8 family serine peptidase [Terrimicrobiaceae bacterium]|nr:S8 family serine peptidase [Terrimicrobiaceae bacterium]